MNQQYSTPPEYWRYEGQAVSDVGTHFESKDGKKIPIVKVWENGKIISKQEYERSEQIDE